MRPQLTKLSEQADQFDTVEHMRRLAHETAQNTEFRRIANLYAVRQKNLPRIYQALHAFLRFERDKPEKQVIRTGTRTLKDRNGNCVDYSVLVAALCITMGLPCCFRMVSFNGEPFSHIYVMVNGKPFDLTLGKEWGDITGIYGREVPFQNKYDFKVN